MKPSHTAFAAIFSLALFVATSCAQPDAGSSPYGSEQSDLLNIGSKAPPLGIAQWVKGDAVGKFEKGQVYVVEFWATWCAPCRSSMPHLSELQAEFQDKVTLVGITNEDEQTVRDFLSQGAGLGEGDESKTWDQVIAYSLAREQGNETTDAYMEAAGLNGIPTAFVVGKDGVIEWIGYPMQLDEPLAEIVAGTWDREAALEKRIQEQREEAATEAALVKIRKAAADKDFDRAIAIVDELLVEFPDSESLPMTRIQIIRMSGDRERLKQGYNDLAKKNWDDVKALDGIAWSIATDAKADESLLMLAKKFVYRASEVAENSSVSVFDTMARIHWQLGEKERAIEFQAKAIELAKSDPEMPVEKLQETLEKYQKEGQ